MSLQNFYSNQSLPLESGQELPEGYTVAYHTYGKLNADQDNVIWICHALTANSDAVDWWSGIVGKGRLFDPNKHFIVCANVIGSCYGSTGPLSINPINGEPFYHNFPLISIRDVVNSLNQLRKYLGITRINTLIGGSLGGMQAMEWAIIQPTLIENLILLSTCAAQSPWGIAFNESQRLAIEADQTWKLNKPQAGEAGLKAARAIALLSYRNYNTYKLAQAEADDDLIYDFKASSYQRYQGDKLVNRFNAFTYYTLSKMMDSHNVGRGRGSKEAALNKIKAQTLVLGIKSDILFPVSEQKFLARHIKGASYVEIESIYGHDGFLIESDKITVCVKEFFRLQEVSVPA